MKQVIIVRQDLKLPKGKLAVQVAHASVEATLRSLKHKKDNVTEWRSEGMKKVVVKVPDEKTMLMHLQKAKDDGLVTALISDAGRTIVEPGTRTCFGIGPDSDEKIDRITATLSMM
mgnify:CR=1 FL=1